MKNVNICKILAMLAILSIVPIYQIAIAAPGVPGSDVNKLIAAVRQATVKYHDNATAEAAGYFSTVECAPNMGIHYINPEILFAPSLPDALVPGILLYAPVNGKLKLVGVEYYAPVRNLTDPTILWIANASTPPPSVGWSTAPSLFGQTFQGPMAAHGIPPEQPGVWHYDLHAYIWQGSPPGIFNETNPTVRC